MEKQKGSVVRFSALAQSKWTKPDMNARNSERRRE
jgi:hypothetical protein